MFNKACNDLMTWWVYPRVHTNELLSVRQVEAQTRVLIGAFVLLLFSLRTRAGLRYERFDTHLKGLACLIIFSHLCCCSNKHDNIQTKQRLNFTRVKKLRENWKHCGIGPRKPQFKWCSDQCEVFRYCRNMIVLVSTLCRAALFLLWAGLLSFPLTL